MGPRCASKTQKICNEFANFCAEFFSRSRRRTRVLRRQTLRRLKRELRRRPTLCAAQNRLNHSRLWRAARQNRKNAATDSNVVDANFAQVHRRTRNFSPIERTSDAASSCGPVLNFSQRRRLQLWCVARQKRRIFATISRIFARKIYTISATNASFACPNIAPTQQRAAVTSGILRTARSENAAASFARRAPKNLKI